ncbi:MAG: nicotinate-nucleotide adenylyltransferase [Peptostreptococcaceae bacterium]
MIENVLNINNKKIEEFNKNCYNINVGIMGGTFNPIHLGHLIISQHIKDALNLDKIIFIPAGNPPHKNIKNIDAKKRYEMVLLSTWNNKDFFVLDFEIKKESYSYTFETLNYLKDTYKNVNLNFLCGADSILDIENWHEFEEIFNMANLVVSTRNSVASNDLDIKIDFLRKKYGANIIKVLPPIIDISSTKLRENLESDKSIRYSVDNEVYKYIKENNLYR